MWTTEPFIQPQLPRATITSHFINVTVLDEYSKEGHLREGWGKDGFPFSFFPGNCTAKFPMEIIRHDVGQWPVVLLTQKLPHY